MKVVEPNEEAEENGFTKLTVKEKVLLQMGEYPCEPDLGEYPYELTQKGLSECLGTRRSHVAGSMKGLLDDKFIELRKGHIEGEGRRQNAYLLTPKGWQRAKEIKERIIHDEVEIDKDGEVQRLRIEEVLKTTKLTLASIINQLEHGGPLSDETTLVTKPGRQLIPVFCPTCMRSFEVENIYGNEEVGFDCPGCGRPYRVVPMQREIPEEKQAPSVPATRAQLASVILTLILAMIVVEISLFAPGLLSSVLFVSLFIAIAVILFLGYFVTWKRPRKAKRKSIVAGGVITTMVLLGLVLVLLWNYLIISVDYERELVVFLVLSAAISLGYLGIPASPIQTRGEYLLTAGVIMVMIALTLPFLRDIEGLTMASVPFLGIVGISAMILSSFHYVDRESQLLDLMLAGGVIIIFVSAVELFPERTDTLDYLILASLILLGLFMASLRFLQMKASVSVGEQFVASVALSTGILFAGLGAFMIWGDSPVAGLAEIALISPFIYYGIRKVFSGEWMYRIPIVAYLGFVEALVIIDAFLT